MSIDDKQFNLKGIIHMAKVQSNDDRMNRMPIMPRENPEMSEGDLIDLKLHAAQEILSEVFGITVVEAKEMIRQRSKERIIWPERFQTDR
ncbi:MAG TPA: hypothetical protein PKV33_04190 [Methanothrix sp.]|nr:hypothetical protein [Methanothrix sp.]